MTALTHITTAMQLLSQLAPGGAPNPSEQTLFLAMLNAMLESWEVQRMRGFNRTVSLTQRSTTESVVGSVFTQLEDGGTETIVVTPVPVTLYTTVSSDNTYAQGWNIAIQYNLAVIIAPSLGVKPSEVIIAKAAEYFAAIKPPEPAPKVTA